MQVTEYVSGVPRLFLGDRLVTKLDFSYKATMSRVWCCDEFESHASYNLATGGVAALLLWGDRGFQSLLQFSPPGNATHSLSEIETAIMIKFCPWCGQNLERQYAS